GMIQYTAEKIAEIKNIPVEDVLRITLENSKRVYNII
ncbi:MAG: TatD family hydrolase, partial [Clostridia bacterium]|nr:TatD family hydrolase [Clostridia bacterium]